MGLHGSNENRKISPIDKIRAVPTFSLWSVGHQAKWVEVEQISRDQDIRVSVVRDIYIYYIMRNPFNANQNRDEI